MKRFAISPAGASFVRATDTLRLTHITICLLVLFLFCTVGRVYAQHYQETDLVSDIPNLAQFTDPDLVNPWGLISTGSSPWWVSDNGTGVSTLYNGSGQKQT